MILRDVDIDFAPTNTTSEDPSEQVTETENNKSPDAEPTTPTPSSP